MPARECLINGGCGLARPAEADSAGRDYHESAWEKFIPFLDYDVEIRKVIYTTDAIESLNARYRRAVRARSHFTVEEAALKCLCLATRALDPAGRGRARWMIR